MADEDGYEPAGVWTPPAAVRAQLHVMRSENACSIEIGTPSKGGALKVYFDPENLEDAKKRVDAAAEVRKYAQLKLNDA
jgi:hypothetical protein